MAVSAVMAVVAVLAVAAMAATVAQQRRWWWCGCGGKSQGRGYWCSEAMVSGARLLTFIINIGDWWTSARCEHWIGSTLGSNHEVGEWGAARAEVSERLLYHVARAGNRNLESVDEQMHACTEFRLFSLLVFVGSGVTI